MTSELQAAADALPKEQMTKEEFTEQWMLIPCQVPEHLTNLTLAAAYYIETQRYNLALRYKGEL